MNNENYKQAPSDTTNGVPEQFCAHLGYNTVVDCEHGCKLAPKGNKVENEFMAKFSEITGAKFVDVTSSVPEAREEFTLYDLRGDWANRESKETILQQINSILADKLSQRTAEAISDYQTNDEQRHLVSAIEIARKERTAELEKEIEGMNKETPDCPLDNYEHPEYDQAIGYNQALEDVLVALRKFY